VEGEPEQAPLAARGEAAGNASDVQERAALEHVVQHDAHGSALLGDEQPATPVAGVGDRGRSVEPAENESHLHLAGRESGRGRRFRRG